MFGARGDVGDWRGGFLPGVASGLLVLCGRFLVWRDWARFGCGARVRSRGVFLGVIRAGVFGVIGMRVFGAWFLAIGWGVVFGLGSGCFGMAVGAHIQRAGSGLFGGTIGWCLARVIFGRWSGSGGFSDWLFLCVIGARVFGRGFRWVIGVSVCFGRLDVLCAGMVGGVFWTGAWIVGERDWARWIIGWCEVSGDCRDANGYVWRVVWRARVFSVGWCGRGARDWRAGRLGAFRSDLRL